MPKDVLIIDDEEWFFEPILERLDHEGISYDYCRAGNEGLNAFKENDYRAIVLDMKIPLGYEDKSIDKYEAVGIFVLEEIRKINEILPVICFTVLSDEIIKNKVSELGGEYIFKAANEHELINRIKKVITP